MVRNTNFIIIVACYREFEFTSLNEMTSLLNVARFLNKRRLVLNSLFKNKKEMYLMRNYRQKENLM
ncbi:hypothetical protein GCM10011344_40290 [Dokdonia pacifica]|nr:hypothetical protein GCM10011344_40290 [Dokdonia pacifica]